MYFKYLSPFPFFLKPVDDLIDAQIDPIYTIYLPNILLKDVMKKREEQRKWHQEVKENLK